jgi:hypothetical protein
VNNVLGIWGTNMLIQKFKEKKKTDGKKVTYETKVYRGGHVKTYI